LELEKKINTIKSISKKEVDELVVFVQNYLKDLLSNENAS